MKRVLKVSVGVASLLLAPKALAQTFPEVEPNSVKAEATVVNAMTAGAALTGTTTDSDNTPGSSLASTVDVFRVRTAPLPLGIYKHTLTFTTSGPTGHTGIIRGLDQQNGVVGAFDLEFQYNGLTDQNSWYGFGKQEQINYEIQGSLGSTTAPYGVTLTTVPVAPIVVAGPFYAGVITVTTAGQGHTTDTELYLYDSNLNPIPLGHHDGFVGSATVSTVTLNLAPGTYFIADSVFNTSNNQSDLAPTEGWDDDALLEYPDAVCCNSGFFGANVAFSVSDGLTTTAVPANIPSEFEIVWATFTVVPLTGPPPNDLCSNASNLGALAGGSTATATNDGVASCDPGGAASRDVWFTKTNTQGNQALLSLDTCGSAIDTVLSVYSACGGSELACNDNCGGSPCGASASCLSVVLNPGQTVKIRVSDKGLVGGSYTLNAGLTPLNDDCATPTQLPGPGSFAIDTTDATTGTQGQSEALCFAFGSNAVNKDLWYTFTPTQGGTLTVTTCNFLALGYDDSKLAVYAGTGCPASGTALACNDDDPNCFSLSSTVALPITCGTTYLIQIGYYGNAPAGIITGQFNVSQTGATCSTPSTPFCSGDTPGTTCLGCGNNGVAGRGCANSAFPAGTLLSSTGIASIATDSLVLNATNIPGPGLYFQANGLIAPTTFGDGMLCAGVGIIRMGVVFPTPTFTSSYPGGLTPNPIHIAGAPINPGDLKHYQVWYRDAVPYCTVSTFNTTNGVSLTWAP